MAGRFSAKTPGAHKKVSIGGGSIAIATGRDDSSYDVGSARDVNDSDGATVTDYNKGKSMGGMPESSLKKGY